MGALDYAAVLVSYELGDVCWTIYHLLRSDSKFPAVTPLACYVRKYLDRRERELNGEDTRARKASAQMGLNL